MSTGTTRADRTVSTDVDAAISPDVFRWLALASVLLLTASYVLVLRDVTAVVGGTRTLFTVVILMLAAATFLAKTIGPRTATVAAVGVAALGFAYYLQVAGIDYGTVVSSIDRFVSDTIALATGLPILHMVEAGVWTLGFAPGPVFLSWYLALRGRYVSSVAAGGGALLFLVFTGDATAVLTLLGAVAGIAAVGFGELERRGGTVAQADLLALLFAATVVLSLSITVVPGGTAGPAFLGDSGGGGTTLEDSVASSPERSTIAGAIELSPEVRFTVRSEEPSYWRTGVYDRFTGGDWIRTGQQEAYQDRLPGPPGETETVRQTVYVEDDATVMPAAPHPVAVEGDATANTLVSPHGQILPDEALIPGDVYNVESAVLNASPEELREAGTDYPDVIEERYLQQPESVSSEFEAETSEIVADEETPYDKAAAIERHLRESKGYSLNVTRPDGNVAEAFLLEMGEGYCVYFATTMVQMLRSEGIPARYVSGYTTGQQVDDNEWVVRGLNAHAWVEVYFPEHGWVSFDPTPSAPRDDDRAERIENAREDGQENVDTDRSEEVSVTETPADGNDTDGNDSAADNGTVPGESPVGPIESPTAPGSDPRFPDAGENSTPGALGPANPGTDEVASTPGGTDDASADRSFDPENAVLGLAVLIGLAAGAHRSGATAQARRSATMYWQGRRRDPDGDVERAFRRLELLLERRYRPRRRGETSRQYFTSLSRTYDVDPRALEVGRCYERSKHGDGVSREAADEVVAAVDGMVRESTPVVGRFWR